MDPSTRNSPSTEQEQPATSAGPGETHAGRRGPSDETGARPTSDQGSVAGRRGPADETDRSLEEGERPVAGRRGPPDETG